MLLTARILYQHQEKWVIHSRRDTFQAHSIKCGTLYIELVSLSMTEIGMVLRDSAWREVKWKWVVEVQEQSKLGVMQRLLVHGSQDRCMDVKCFTPSLSHLCGIPM